jgi:hypothetical protein
MDIEFIRLRSELIALEALVIAVFRDMQRQDPALSPSLRVMASRTTEEYSRIPVKHPSPEIADLMAAEFQVAWERLLQRVILR